MPEAERKDFYLYVDEFHNLVTDSFVNLFSEARKYGVDLTVAHQYTSQLLPEVLDTVLGNVANMVIFRVGGDDAAKLETEMTPLFKAKDMINLGMQEFYIKETIDGETYDPFSAETLKVLPAPHPSYKERIKEVSRRRYAMRSDDVKRMLEQEQEAVLFRRGAAAAAPPAVRVEAAPRPVPAPEPKSESGGAPPEPLI
jgi:hypothetical protein